MCTKKAVYRKSNHKLPFVKPISPSLTLFHQVKSLQESDSGELHSQAKPRQLRTQKS